MFQNHFYGFKAFEIKILLKELLEFIARILNFLQNHMNTKNSWLDN